MKIRNSMLLDFCGTIFASLVTGLVCSTLMAALVLILTHSASTAEAPAEAQGFSRSNGEPG